MKFFTRSGIGVLTLMVLAGLILMPDHATGKNDGYTVKLLKNPIADSYIYANDINNAGRIVGGHEYFVEGTGWFQKAVLWKKWSADPVVLKPLEGQDHSLAAAINNSHVACGWSYGGGTVNAVIWDKKGKAVDMHPDLDRTYSQAFAINQYGDVAGIAWSLGVYGRAFLTCVGEDAVLLDMDTDDYIHCWPHAVNKKCVVVGFARSNAWGTWGPIHACYWDEDGDFEDLHDDIEDDLGITVFASRAWTVSDKGEIGGVAVVSYQGNGGTDDDLRAFVWTKKGGFDWIDADGADLSSVGGGAGKYMVGIVDGALQGWDWYSATTTIWTRKTVKGTVTWDFEIIPLPEGHVGAATWGVNNSGRVAGVSIDEDGYWHAWYAED